MPGVGTLLTSETILVRRSEPIAATVDGKVVLLSVEAGAYFGLNNVGSAIWNMLEKPCRVGDMLDTLAQTHHVDCDTVTRDVTAFLDTLIERRLARAVAPGDIQ
jgi:Coenzyme PQQ synthesis protein D (PqqD)